MGRPRAFVANRRATVKTMRTLLYKVPALLGRVGKSVRGVALTEFAVVAPVFISVGLFGFEVAYMAVTKMKVNQIALSVADNASRLGQTDNGAVPPTITENEVTAILDGANKQGGSIELKTNGRIILSSLEFDPITDRQFIHWQRCYGDKDIDSAYGNDTDKNGLSGAVIEGMGSGETKAIAPPNEAVMFVEIYYEYPAVFSSAFVSDVTFREEAAFIIRDDRTLLLPEQNGLVGTEQNLC